MKQFLICLVWLAGFVAAMRLTAAGFDTAATATNQLGVDLHRQLAAGEGNLCLSPYSIQSALAMAFAGDEAQTQTEMARILHFPDGDEKIHAAFASLQRSLEEMAKKSAAIADESKRM